MPLLGAPLFNPKPELGPSMDSKPSNLILTFLNITFSKLIMDAYIHPNYKNCCYKTYAKTYLVPCFTS